MTTFSTNKTRQNKQQSSRYTGWDRQTDRASLVSGTPTPPPPPTGRVEQRGIRHQHVTGLVAHLVKISTKKEKNNNKEQNKPKWLSNIRLIVVKNLFIKYFYAYTCLINCVWILIKKKITESKNHYIFLTVLSLLVKLIQPLYNTQHIKNRLALVQKNTVISLCNKNEYFIRLTIFQC